MTRLLLAWIALCVLLAIEAGAAALHAGWLGWAAAPVMVAVVALAFMHAAQASALARIFGVAGLFWVAILLLLGSVDYLARHDDPSERTSIDRTGLKS